MELLSVFDLKEGVYYQKELNRHGAFENSYLGIRKKEQRVYTDEQLAVLPQVPSPHPLYEEWLMRYDSAKRLLLYLKKKKFKNVLDLGCGNGWLSNLLARHCGDVTAMDINEFELKQGARVFNDTRNLHFVYADILKYPFGKRKLFDLIILASSIQYFPDLKMLLHTLQNLLADKGEIHILDSPIYSTSEAENANERSHNYFKDSGFEELADFYHHHRWKDLREFQYRVLYDPASASNRIRKLLKPVSPFFWIRITKRS